MVLKDKVAVITGGSSGIGKAIARCFAAEGAKVVFTYCSNSAGADALAAELTAAGAAAAAVQADVGREADVKRLFDQVKRLHGGLDILINNAGRTFNVSFQDYTEQTLRRDLDSNLMGAMLCSKYAAPLMGERGWIVNTASIRGMYDDGRPGIMGYCAAKAGVISFTKNLALELAPRVFVNAVCPGFVYTPYMENNVSDEMKANWLKNIPMKTFVDIDELARVYLFLATTTVITGTSLPVDGGYTILNR